MSHYNKPELARMFNYHAELVRCIDPQYRHQFAVKALGMDISVATFTAAALVCLGVIVLRRYQYGAELGGERLPARLHAAFFVCLWIAYIAVSASYAECKSCKDSDDESEYAR